MDEKNLVLDFGSQSAKAGFAGDDAPRAVFPSMIGRPKYRATMVGMGNRDRYVGDEAQAFRGMLELKYPTWRGNIENWDDLEILYHHTFYNELRITPTGWRALISDRPTTSKAQREKLCQMVFETFSLAGAYIAIDGILDLYASGRTTGISLDSGDGMTCAVPVWEGYTKRSLFVCQFSGGYDVTRNLTRILRETGHHFTSSAEMEIVRDMKEKHAYVAEDYQSELRDCVTIKRQTTYECPDGKMVKLGNERFRCTEVLFQPRLIGYDEGSGGIPEIIARAMMTCPVDTRPDMYTSVVLSGGNTLLQGFTDRVAKDLTALVPKSVKVISAPERKYNTWIGGSVLGSLSTFQGYFITKAEYEEAGPTIVHRKCF